MLKWFGLLALTATIASGPALADEAQLGFGGDQYVAGQVAAVAAPVDGDAFAAGYDVSLSAPVVGDAHLFGFNVTSNANVGGDFYAAGSSVTVNSPVGDDVTAAGSSIAIRNSAAIGGNVRLAGATVTISAPIAGSALVTAQTLTIESTIAGDLNFFGENLSFGPAARITGKVIIQAPKEIPVPASVAAPGQVSFTQLAVPDYANEAGKTAEHVVKGVWPAIWATGTWWLLLAIVGLLFITLGTRRVAALEVASTQRPVRTFGLGILGFSSAVGLVPVFALSLIGIVLLPFVALFAVAACALAYLGGTYLLGLRIARALLPIDTNLKRVGVLVVAIIVAGLVGSVPVIGWLVTLCLLAFGFGVVGRMMLLGRSPAPPIPLATA